MFERFVSVYRFIRDRHTKSRLMPLSDVVNLTFGETDYHLSGVPIEFRHIDTLFDDMTEAAANGRLSIYGARAQMLASEREPKVDKISVEWWASHSINVVSYIENQTAVAQGIWTRLDRLAPKDAYWHLYFERKQITRYVRRWRSKNRVLRTVRPAVYRPVIVASEEQSPKTIFLPADILSVDDPQAVHLRELLTAAYNDWKEKGIKPIVFAPDGKLSFGFPEIELLWRNMGLGDVKA